MIEIEHLPKPGDPGKYAEQQVASTLAAIRVGALATRGEAIDIDPDSWMPDANCKEVGPDVMFPSDGTGVKVAQRVCAGCPVKTQCLEYALEARIEHGVWGQKSERERRRIYKARGLITPRTPRNNPTA